jgi:hypothetical protein
VSTYTFEEFLTKLTEQCRIHGASKVHPTLPSRTRVGFTSPDGVWAVDSERIRESYIQETVSCLLTQGLDLPPKDVIQAGFVKYQAEKILEALRAANVQPTLH